MAMRAVVVMMVVDGEDADNDGSSVDDDGADDGDEHDTDGDGGGDGGVCCTYTLT